MSEEITFPEWVAELEADGSTKDQIAKDCLGITKTSLYRYLAKERVPNRHIMAKISAASSGRVRMSWFFEPAGAEAGAA